MTAVELTVQDIAAPDSAVSETGVLGLVASRLRDVAVMTRRNLVRCV